MKQYIKHNLQNKLHRCADPGDLVKLDQLVERVDREGRGWSLEWVLMTGGWFHFKHLLRFLG